jgi:hypothetical protein
VLAWVARICRPTKGKPFCAAGTNFPTGAATEGNAKIAKFSCATDSDLLGDVF